MNTLDLALHLLNFAAPALVLALLLPLAARHLLRLPAGRLATWQAVGSLSLIGLVALGLGLWCWGRDGKMASYGLLLLAQASGQWVLSKAWQR